MPRKKKPDPENHCVQCGALMSRKNINGRWEDRAVFLRRRYCDRACMARAFMKIDPTLSALRRRSHKFAKGSCEVCGSTEQLAVHHMDENPTNNAPENTPTLCNRCHKTWHHHFGIRTTVDAPSTEPASTGSAPSATPSSHRRPAQPSSDSTGA